MLKKDNKYFKLGLTLLMVIVVSVLFFVILTNLKTVGAGVKKLLGIVSSVIYGFAFAYIMNPIMVATERLVNRIFSKGNITERALRRLSRALGVLTALIVFISVVYGLLAMVVPRMIDSLIELFSPENLDSYYQKITAWINNVTRDTPLEEWVRNNDVLLKLQEWITKKIDLVSAINTAALSVYGFAKSVFNMIIGIVVAVYLLISKEKFLAQAKKIVVASFKQSRADRLMEIGRLANKSLGGFLVGKLIDSLIIGILSYIGMTILRLPYALISSVFVGLSNIIPFFGPIIGIVIGGILILLQSPVQALYFVIFEFALQQVDGNIIGPRILGERLGISDFWILVSITVFGGLFGFPGMLLGVPVFTVIYAIIAQNVNESLQKKNLPVRTDLYYTIETVEDLEKYQKEFAESTVFYSGDSFETEYDPDDDIEYDGPEEQ